MEISKFEKHLGVNGHNAVMLCVLRHTPSEANITFFIELSEDAYHEWVEKFESEFMRSDGLPSDYLKKFKGEGTWYKVCRETYASLCAAEFDKVIELENLKMSREKHMMGLFGLITRNELVATMQDHLIFMRLSVPKYISLRNELKMKVVIELLDTFTDELIEQIAHESSQLLVYA